MRELTHQDIQIVSGGISCIDASTWENIHKRAVSDGLSFATITDVLLMCATYGIVANFAVTAAPIMAAGGVGFVAAPYLFMFGYYTSGSWKILNPSSN